ncbi:MAG: hypothetical protein ABI282_08755, partial [Candidatus Baltobacteraceae bacterium]
ICAGYLVHLAVLGNIIALAACVAVISATAAAALALGIASGAARAFEMAYLVLWYVGPINALPPLDFAGGTIAAPLVVVSIATVVLIAAFALAAASRWRARTFA